MLPNFIIIGAAKAGTTALYWYMAEHPQIYMSPVKETNYFAYGVDNEGQPLYGDPELHHFPVRTLREYEELFADANGAAAVGEASPMYLECPQAAARIRERLPTVRLVCCLRNPVDRAYSDYLMYLRNRGRSLEPQRSLTVTADWIQSDSHWIRLGRYYQQLSRYFEAFPRSQIHVFLFDDLKQNPKNVVQEVYRFLGVNPAFLPDFHTPYGVGGVPASMLLHRFFTSAAIRAVVEPWMPKRAMKWAWRLRTWNMQQAPPLPAELRKMLVRHFSDDIAKTSELIGRSLEHWL